MPQEYYKEQIQLYTRERDSAKKKHRLLSIARFAVFAAGIILTGVAFNMTELAAIPVMILFLALFLYLMRAHVQVGAKRDKFDRLVKLNQKELKALGWDWKDFDAGDEFIDANHAFSFDLDIFGKGSLFQYINRCCSLIGKKRLAEMLTSPALVKEEIVARMEAIHELAQKADWRQDFLTQAGVEQEAASDQGSLTEWMTAPPLFSNPGRIRLLLVIFPMILLILLLLYVFNIMTIHFALLMILVHFGVVGFFLKRINHVHGQVSRKFELLSKYAGLLLAIEKEDFNASYLKDQKSRLTKGQISAGQGFFKLAGLIQALDNRLNMASAFIQNGLLMWDLQCVYRMEQWRKKHRDDLAIWLEVCGEFDALSSFGNYAFNRPELKQPEIEDGPFRMEALELGHPLLDPKMRIDNDFSLSTKGRFSIITGANMAGKSTFLRTIGVNMVLAMCGAPVCASKLSLRPIRIMTSVRMTDSLSENESYFFAELKRLKSIIDTLKSGENVFVIVDEMLKGTNSKDKHTGSVGLLEQMIELEAVGLIATHDLELGKMAQKYPELVRNERFEVEIGDDKLSFDYKLKPGISQNLNATFLMKQMGIMK